MTHKAESLKHWANLDPGQHALKAMTPIAYKATGSSYGDCGIRIDGNPAFIDAVLSNLKTLLDGENHITRLELARSPVAGKHPMSGKEFGKADADAEVCYVRLHERGREGQIASAFFDKHLDAATERMFS